MSTWPALTLKARPPSLMRCFCRDKGIRKPPSAGRLLALLGNALLMQERVGEARVVYAKGLLAVPREMEQMEDRELTMLVEDVGPCMAPIHGWFRGVQRAKVDGR